MSELNIDNTFNGIEKYVYWSILVNISAAHKNQW